MTDCWQEVTGVLLYELAKVDPVPLSTTKMEPNHAFSPTAHRDDRLEIRILLTGLCRGFAALLRVAKNAGHRQLRPVRMAAAVYGLCGLADCRSPYRERSGQPN